MGRIVEPAGTDSQSDVSLAALIKLASASAGWTERNARYLIDKIEQLEAAATWHRKIEGEPKTWERFCQEVLGYDAGYVEKIREGLELLEADGVTTATAGQAVEECRKRGGQLANQNASKQKTNVDIIHNRFPERPAGTSVAASLRRLQRDRPDLAAKVLDGEMSAHAAAQEAGFRLKQHTIPHDTQKAAAAIKRHFTRVEREEMALLILEGRD